MKVCIAEKPSVAREIAHILNAKTKKDGYFEGNGYQVTWTFGHFCTLYAPDEYFPHWKSWDLYSLPMLPERFKTRVMDDKGVQKQYKTIKTLLDNASEVINCGDAGQEGELIQRWVINEADYKGPVKRLWISSLTSEAIINGFKNLKPAEEFDNLYYAGSSRAIGDWLLGMNATRLFTLKYAAQKQVLSVGRVQTPTLAMIVKRHHEITNFKPEPYWEIQTEYRNTIFNSEKGKYKSQEDGKKVMDFIQGKPFEIESSTKKKGKESAPRLFDLTGLQVYCNNKFGYSADQTLKLIQGLYEKKVVTYPRVDTTYLPTDIYPKVGGILQKLSAYAIYTESVLKTKIPKSKKVFDDTKITDHHAIIPTGYEVHLQPLERNVYDAVTRRFIAVFYPDCIISNTTVKGFVDEIKFKATGKEILEEGWRILYPKSKSAQAKKADEEAFMPTFVKGEKGEHKPSFLEKQTKPPKTYSEASLLRSMETAGKQMEDEEMRDLLKQNGIGRPSTRASIIETLFKRKYIRRNKKQILPTDLGVQLIGLIQNDLLKSAELTGQWEKQLKDIESGNYSAQAFISNMKKMVDELVLEVQMAKYQPRLTANNNAPVKKEKPKGIGAETCPKCKKGNILTGKNSYGCSGWKDGCDFRLPFSFLAKKITEKQWIRLIKKGSTVNLKGFKADNGGKTEGVIQLKSDYKLEFIEKQVSSTQISSTEEVPDPIPCPKCNRGTVVKGQTAYGCSAWKNGCNFKVTFEFIRKQVKGENLTKYRVWTILKSQK
ncbi:MAG: DNA topoisomerase 3 [Flavobacteriales bacterium]